MFRWMAVAFLSVSTAAQALDPRLYTIGSGDVNGSYYAAATALCQETNRAEAALRCSPEATPGSIYNMEALRNRQLDFAIVQSDVQNMALTGEGPFLGKPAFSDLRSVMSLYPETLTVLSRPDAHILSLGGLVGKRVDIGLPASGRQATAMRLLTALGLDRTDFRALLELSTGTGLDELCAGRIDATVLILGHPSSVVDRAINECDARLVNISGPEVRAFIEANDDYVYSSIPRSVYGKKGRILSIGVLATLVTRTDMPDDIVAAIIKNTIANLPSIGVSAAVLEKLSVRDMQESGLAAPLHPAAAAMFAEIGK
ncbi:TAXI family TRAP transporter solute-binding subunit [Paracoccus haeundaensis]|uniref:TAXI family TRAP transporter solute-binding subunit n=1 Tax=Paracoccus haeundaensis TaxID=225362 RepID=A0A5C4R1X0_9RHOB|nr:TAXI family TRAP transporter solute-binding subunit [Paracoccus haeundaensis]TNH37677.1 TAXI family TRAP transporter solute-binding subunit [Paracoccus haeundaensis]